jgi:L-asparagine transporter-like permease
MKLTIKKVDNKKNSETFNNVIKDKTYIIKDDFQNYIQNVLPNIKNYSLIVDAILFIMIFVLYYTGNNLVYQYILKLLAIILLVRYIFNNLTVIKINYKDNNNDNEGKNQDKNKVCNYSQINSSLAIFTIIAFTLINISVIDPYIGYFIIFTYFFLTTGVGYNLTTDGIITILLAYIISNLQI